MFPTFHTHSRPATPRRPSPRFRSETYLAPRGSFSKKQTDRSSIVQQDSTPQHKEPLTSPLSRLPPFHPGQDRQPAGFLPIPDGTGCFRRSGDIPATDRDTSPCRQLRESSHSPPDKQTWPQGLQNRTS